MTVQIENQDKELLRSRVMQWRNSSDALRAVWEAELRSPDYFQQTMKSFASALNWACQNAPVRETSGLVEQQYYFRKLAATLKISHSDQGIIMIELFEAAKQIASFFENKKWDYAFIGGLAVLRWGNIRMTADVDVTLLTRYEDEEHFIDEILNDFRPRISDAQNFALKNRVILAKAENGIAIDISLGGLPFEEQMVKRSSFYCFSSNATLRTCSAEDLIVFKAFAGRHKDWSDIDAIRVKQTANLDLDYIFSHITLLCELKEDTETVCRLRQMFPG